MALSPDFLPFAHQLADAAGAVIRDYFGAHGEVEAKGDQTPVTQADRAAEATMRKLIEQHYPNHDIYGEEFGQTIEGTVRSASEPRSGRVSEAKGGKPPSIINYTWVLDPIDGTRAFIAGRKEWGTLIALCADGVPILGILDQPVTGERWVGLAGEPTQYFSSPLEGERGLPLQTRGGSLQHPPPHRIAHALSGSPSRGELTSTRPCANLADAEFSTTSVNYFTPMQAANVVKLAQSCRSTVRDGDCYAYGLLARGLRDIVVDAGLKPYDILALVPIIEGAGGKITAWDSAPVTLTHFDTALAATTQTLHGKARAILSGADGT